MRAVNYRPSYIGFYISMGPSCRSPVGACQSSDIYCIKSCAELLTPGISREPELPPADLLKFFIHCQFLAPRPWRALLLVSFRLFNYQWIDCTHERVDFGQLKVDSAAASRLDLFSANDLDIKVRYGHQKKSANFQWPSVYGGNNTSDPYILASAGSPAVGSVHVIAVVGILGLNARRCLDDKTTPAETPKQMLSPPSLSRKIWYACWYNRTQLFLFAVPSFSLIPISGGVSDFIASV